MTFGIVCVVAGFLAGQSQSPSSWYTAFENPEWLLAILAVPTLIFVAIQAVQAKNAAKAALLNAQAVINNERPWIMLKAVQPKEHYWNAVVMTETAKGKAIYAVPHFKNYGNTPAWIVQSTAFIKLCDDPGLEQSIVYNDPPLYTSPSPLPPGKMPTFIFRAEMGKVLNPQEIRMLENESAYFILYGFLKYRDPFFEQTQQLRETFFCLRYYVRFAMWQPYGPPGANKHT
jgi:hypothetical protein